MMKPKKKKAIADLLHNHRHLDETTTPADYHPIQPWTSTPPSSSLVYSHHRHRRQLQLRDKRLKPPLQGSSTSKRPPTTSRVSPTADSSTPRIHTWRRRERHPRHLRSVPEGQELQYGGLCCYLIGRCSQSINGEVRVGGQFDFGTDGGWPQESLRMHLWHV